MTPVIWRLTWAVVLIGLVGTVAGSAAATVAARPLTTLSVDPYTNDDSYHRTALEPDSYSFGSTIVATYQVGRTRDGGSSNIGWVTSNDDGQTWEDGFLPCITTQGTPPGQYDRASDPSVAYDAAHGVWLISSLAVECCVRGVAILVNRSKDQGHTWGPPIHIDDAGASRFFDKGWIACDNWPDSPYYGRCYAQWDDANSGSQLYMARSTDGGLTWHNADVPRAKVIGGQPVVQPGGRVIVPIAGLFGSMKSFVSDDGGRTYSGPFSISDSYEHPVAGRLRTEVLPSAEIDGGGRVYVVWHDCRFRARCRSNDIVMSTSANGEDWTSVVRIPMDPTTSEADHFIPGLAVDPGSGGGSARLALAFYLYPDRTCSPSTCRLEVGFTSSADGGASWTTPVVLAGPFTNTWLPLTTQGYMVGDYISTSWASTGIAFPIFAAARAGECQLGQLPSCRETVVTPTGGIAPSGPLTPLGEEFPVAVAPARPATGPVTAN